LTPERPRRQGDHLLIPLEATRYRHLWPGRAHREGAAGRRCSSQAADLEQFQPEPAGALIPCVGGALVARLTDRPVIRSVPRQLLPCAAAVVIIYLIGHLVGTTL
jgi:hypothetical protein